MPLAGDQKRVYQREYMRRRRAGQPPPPPNPWQPSDSMLHQVKMWAKDKRQGRRLRMLARLALGGLDLNGEGWREEACNRLREHEAELRRARKRRANAEPVVPEPRVNDGAKGSGSGELVTTEDGTDREQGTAREVYLKAISEDRRFRLLPPSGETLAIVGARPPVKA